MQATFGNLADGKTGMYFHLALIQYVAVAVAHLVVVVRQYVIRPADDMKADLICQLRLLKFMLHGQYDFNSAGTTPTAPMRTDASGDWLMCV
nr:hypothetical protein [Aliamphritea spongicola]